MANPRNELEAASIMAGWRPEMERRAAEYGPPPPEILAAIAARAYERRVRLELAALAERAARVTDQRRRRFGP